MADRDATHGATTRRRPIGATVPSTRDASRQRSAVRSAPSSRTSTRTRARRAPSTDPRRARSSSSTTCRWRSTCRFSRTSRSRRVEGETVVIVGESGTGKSTMLKLHPSSARARPRACAASTARTSRTSRSRRRCGPAEDGDGVSGRRAVRLDDGLRERRLSAARAHGHGRGRDRRPGAGEARSSSTSTRIA